MSRAVLALGANLGDREATLRAALRGLGARLVTASDGYQTPPWGDPDQPPYLNAVAVVEDDTLDAAGWLALAHRLEAAGGRVRDPARRYAPRTLDVDVIAVWRNESGAGPEPVVQDDPVLTLPHPRAHLRAFVLVPWAEIEPAAQLPGHGPIAALLHTAPVAPDVPNVTRIGPLAP